MNGYRITVTDEVTLPRQVAQTAYVVQVWNGRRWAKVRGYEGGPFRVRGRAERNARLRAALPRRLSSTEGMEHRVVEVTL